MLSGHTCQLEGVMHSVALTVCHLVHLEVSGPGTTHRTQLEAVILNMQRSREACRHLHVLYVNTGQLTAYPAAAAVVEGAGAAGQQGQAQCMSQVSSTAREA